MGAPKGNQYAKGNKGGAPLIYDDERIEEEARALIDWIKDADDDDKKIYLGNFALSRGYHRKRLAEFANDNKVFASAYDLAKLWQEHKFIRNGLTKRWDPGFTQYVMARVCAPEWKKAWDTAIDPDAIKQAIETAIMNYSSAQQQGEGWQKPKSE